MGFWPSQVLGPGFPPALQSELLKQAQKPLMQVSPVSLFWQSVSLVQFPTVSESAFA